MNPSIFRVLAFAVALGASIVASAPRAQACGYNVITEEDRVWWAVTAYLKDPQNFGGNTRIEAVELANERVATARWEASPADGHVTHAVLLKLEGRWQVIGTRRVAQSSSASKLSSSPAEVANKR